MSEIERLLEEQADYYRERAPEYDDWWLRRGRYDHGPDANARWVADASLLEVALDRFKPEGDVLELACGTGLWTRRLVTSAHSILGVDGSSEMLELNRARLGVDPRVEYLQADLFEWEPNRLFDVCFFSFWLSHVPAERFATFWEKVGRALAPEGRVFFLDSSRSDLASAVDHRLPARSEQTMLRRLADGREYQIVKRFYEPDLLRQQLAELGWSAEIHTTPEFFLYGQATLG
jgi:ubiquinone/menaquinone biosynthesis C-methylase UbiE